MSKSPADGGACRLNALHKLHIYPQHLLQASRPWCSSWEPLIGVYISNHWPFQPDSTDRAMISPDLFLSITVSLHNDFPSCQDYNINVCEQQLQFIISHFFVSDIILYDHIRQFFCGAFLYQGMDTRNADHKIWSTPHNILYLSEQAVH